MDVSLYLYRKYQELLIFHMHTGSGPFDLISSLIHCITYNPSKIEEMAQSARERDRPNMWNYKNKERM